MDAIPDKLDAYYINITRNLLNRKFKMKSMLSQSDLPPGFDPFIMLAIQALFELIEAQPAKLWKTVYLIY